MDEKLECIFRIKANVGELEYSLFHDRNLRKAKRHLGLIETDLILMRHYLRQREIKNDKHQDQNRQAGKPKV